MKKLVSFLSAFAASLFVMAPAFAQEAAAPSGAPAFKGIAVAICMGFAAGMGALGQSRAATAALEGIARNPQAAGVVQTPMIIAMALMESLVILAFVISILLLGKI
jgi:F-type H+-transporting ATPase subunit c